MRGPTWEAALAAAKRLDHTKTRSAANQTELIPAPPPANFLGRLFRRLFPRRDAEQLNEFFAIRAFLQQAPQAAAQQSEIEWGPLKHGFGSRMKARLLPGGQQKGSLPTPARFDARPAWKELYKRKLLDGKTLYARGHLLHCEGGGPGLDYNMTPLTAAPQGDFGANHANFGMRSLVEGPVLSAYHKMHAHLTITDITYEVVADHNRQPREGSAELGKIAEVYEEVVKQISVSLGHEPTHQEVMDKLALNPPSAHLHDAMLAIEAKPSENWEDVYKRVEKNQKLWELEDRIVANALHITYFWTENGIPTQPRKRTIIIDLPNSLDAIFKE